MPSASDILAAWGLNLPDHPVLASPADGLVELKLADAAPWLQIEGTFGDSCSVFVNTAASPATKVHLRRMGPAGPVDNVKLCLLGVPNNLELRVGGSDNRLFIGRVASPFFAVVNMWGNARLAIGDGATCNQARIVLDDSDIVIGRDCMLSDELLLQSADQHGVIDLTNMEPITRPRCQILLGEHVWIGRRAMLMPGATVGAGAIVAAGAIVTHAVEPCTVAAGVPAATIRRNVSWSRDRHGLRPDELGFLDESML